MEGWFKVYRKLDSNPIWHCEPFSKGQAWIDLILLATHDEKYLMVRGIQVKLNRGQVGWSEPKLAKRWQWSRTKVRAFLKLLKKEQQIIIEKNNVTQVVTLVNYDKYQPEKTADQTAERQQTRQQKDPNKNVKNVKNVKNIGEEKISSTQKDSVKKSLEEKKGELRAEIFSDEYQGTYGRVMLDEFFAYWSEPNRSGTKMRCELQPTWDTARRLATWKRNEKPRNRSAEQRNDMHYLR